MDLSGRPLLDTRLDRHLYLHRSIHDELLRNALHETNALVLGRRGSGKTTLLHQLAGDLRGRAVRVAEVDGRLAATPPELVRLVRSRLAPSAEQPRTLEERWQAKYASLDAAGPLDWDGTGEVQGPLDVVHQIARDLGTERCVVLCDEPAPKVAHTVFGRLRDELWQLPVTWIVAGNDSDAPEYLTAPADAFFERVARIPELTEEEQHRLIDIRAEGEVPAGRLDGVKGETPRDVIRIARVSLDDGQDADTVSNAMAELDARVTALGRPAAMAFAELRSFGSASASDKRFLDRLGWTRERATQVLHRLEKAGAVESFSERGEHGGRPRRVYRAREAV